jgi:hypothetical protein
MILNTDRNVTLDKACTEWNELSVCQMTRADLTTARDANLGEVVVAQIVLASNPPPS